LDVSASKIVYSIGLSVRERKFQWTKVPGNESAKVPVTP